MRLPDVSKRLDLGKVQAGTRKAHWSAPASVPRKQRSLGKARLRTGDWFSGQTEANRLACSGIGPYCECSSLAAWSVRVRVRVERAVCHRQQDERQGSGI